VLLAFFFLEKSGEKLCQKRNSVREDGFPDRKVGTCPDLGCRGKCGRRNPLGIFSFRDWRGVKKGLRQSPFGNYGSSFP
jgi:hypothetical protein